MHITNLGTFKQTLLAINNEVNNEVFGRGLQTQKVFVNEDVILILSINHRVPALATLDNFGVPTREIDWVLIDAHKKRLRELVEERMGLPVKSIFKDYDPQTQTSVNIIVLEEQPLLKD